MPFALVAIGLLLIITSAQDTYVQMGKQISKDFTGQGSFVWWALALLMAGIIGYVEKLRPLSAAFMGLILVVLLLKNKDFFTQLTSAFQKGPTKPQVGAGGATPSVVSQATTAVTNAAAGVAGNSGTATGMSGTSGDMFATAAKTLLELGF